MNTFEQYVVEYDGEVGIIYLVHLLCKDGWPVDWYSVKKIMKMIDDHDCICANIE